MTLLIISFIAGVLTVLAPCVLPLLPVIVGGSLADGKVHVRRALVVTGALGISVIVFTFILKVSTLFISIPESFWTAVSAVIIIGFGLVTLFPRIWDRLSVMTKLYKSSNRLMAEGYKKQSFWGDVIVGASLGPVFATCSPTYFIILATVLPVTPLLGFIDILAYAVGLCISLFIVAIAGQKIVDKLGIASDPNGWFKKVLGLIFIIVGIAIATGFDKVVEAKILSSGVFDITTVEQKLLRGLTGESGALVPTPVSVSTTTTPNSVPTPVEVKPITQKKPAIKMLSVLEKSLKYPRAPEITSPSGFINAGGADGHGPITISQFKGKKVVLLDVWTYSCINCQRTLPYLVDWYKKYKDQGLEIISIHTPEFAFEKKIENVEDAVARFGIKYPVVLDNDYATWNALRNQYWPRKYLVDVDGFIVYDHIGEGDYGVTEGAIQAALAELHARSGDVKDGADGVTPMPMTKSDPADKITFDEGKVGSPETYFGSDRNIYLANGVAGKQGSQTLSLPTPISSVAKNSLYLGGTWDFKPEYIENSTAGSIVFKYQAKNVYMVASADVSNAPNGVMADIYIDGKFINTINIKEERLYDIVKGTDYGEHVLEIRLKGPWLKAFTFTFG